MVVLPTTEIIEPNVIALSVHAPSHLVDYSYQIEMELVYMSQAIVPLSQSKSRRLEKSSKSGLLFKCRIGFVTTP